MDIEDILMQVKGVVFDFDGVFTDNRVLVIEDGKEGVFCNRADGIGLKRLRSLDIPMIIISSEKNNVVSRRGKKLEIQVIQGVDDKLEELKKYSNKIGIALDKLAYLGNDVNDLECLRAVGVPVAVADAHEKVKTISKIILTKGGGKGAVREFCDCLFAVLYNGEGIG
tara:strand:+ start:4053 stop:4556 length:504 start_codon:yes stop_codon:yes gene_type:complete